MLVYITRNPYEWIRYVTYIFLAISFVSMVWNRCNERNVYTRTWKGSFIMGNMATLVYSMCKLNHIAHCQSWILTGRLFYELEIAYILVTCCLWSVVAVEYWEQRQSVRLSMKLRRRFFYSIYLLLLGIGFAAFWQLNMATMAMQVVFQGAHRYISQLYEILFFCVVFTEGGYRKRQKQ